MISRPGVIRAVEQLGLPLGLGMFFSFFLFFPFLFILSGFGECCGSQETERDGEKGGEMMMGILADVMCCRSWDPATGLGTPNYMLLAKVFTDLP